MNSPEPLCYHCGLSVPPGTDFAAEVGGETRAMCCRGCQAVAEAIVGYGLTDYYKHRTALPVSPRDAVPDALAELALYDRPELQQNFVRATGEVREASLILEGITCAACIWLNERHLKQVPGVVEVQVNYATHRARVSWDEGRTRLSTILSEVERLGYRAHPFSAEEQSRVRQRERGGELRRIAVAGLSAMQAMMVAVALYAGEAGSLEQSIGQLLRWFSMLMTLPVVFYSATPFYRSAWRAMKARTVNMDVPVTLAILAAFVGSVIATWRGSGPVYYDAVSMFALFLLGTRFLERNARHRSAEAAENLLKLAPAFATRVSGDEHHLVPVVDLRADDVILVKPGESVAADGVVARGESSADEALLTGESRSVRKGPGDAVIAGSVNLEGPLFVRVTGTGENTVLAGIVRLLERAQGEKPRLAKFADRVAGQFTWGLLAFTAAAGIGWYFADPGRVFDITLAILVVTCPCALSLAAPAAFAAAGSRLLSRGVLLTRGHALETLARVRRVVFDKTGTLTRGRPTLAEVVPLGKLDRERCLALAASLEQASEHPLAASFLAAVRREQLLPVAAPENLPGKGVRGVVDGVAYRLGNADLVAGEAIPAGVKLPGGATIVWLADDAGPLALFALADALRPEAVEAVRNLRNAGYGVSVLSGDGEAAVAHVARELGVDDWHHGLKPEDKLAALKAMQGKGEVVAMVGDGVNDAPVLAAADVSLAMGGGTRVAQATSDLVLLSEHVGDVELALKTGTEAIAIMRQNFAWVMVYNLVALPFAALGYMPPWLAALGMSLSSLVVVLNALRLR